MFDQLYQQELRALRDIAPRYAENQPRLAQALAGTTPEPHIEHLVQSVAFLAARVQQRIDACTPELTQSLLEALFPQALRPLPSTTILKLSPYAQRAPRLLPRHTPFGGQPLHGCTPLFRSTDDILVVPADIVGQHLESSGDCISLRFDISSAGGATAAILRQSSLPVFLGHDRERATLLRLLLTEYLRDIVLVGEDVDGRPHHIPCPNGRWCTPNPDQEPPLWPCARPTARSVQRLQEYFLFPQKYHFVRLEGLPESQPICSDAWSLIIRLRRSADALLKDWTATESPDLAFNHVPVVNLYETPAEPLENTAWQRRHPLQAAHQSPAHSEVYDVLHVVGQMENGVRTPYRAFGSDSLNTPHPEHPHFHLQRTNAADDEGIDTELIVGLPWSQPPASNDINAWPSQRLSATLLCSHRNLAAELGPGDVRVAVRGTPNWLRFHNPGPITKPQRPSLGGELLWQLLAHLDLRHRSLGSTRGLKAQLQLFLPQKPHPAHRDARGRVDAIRHVRTSVVTMPVDQAPLLGSQVHIELDPKPFAGPGDLRLFGEILRYLLADAAHLNSFVALTLQAGQLPAQRWSPRCGTKTLV